MKIIGFTIYYLMLRLRILFGLHSTANPVGWRWQYRNDTEERRKRHAKKH